MAAFFPDAGRVSHQQGANPAGVVSRQRLPRGERSEPLKRQVCGGPFGDANTPPQTEIEHGGPDNRRAGNVLLVPGQEDAAGCHPRPILGKDQLLGLEGVPDVLSVGGRATVEHLVEAAIPFLDLMRWGLIRLRQSAQPIEQASRPARRAADTQQI